ncbi:MAG: hypothetical protein KBS76_01425, partial [Ruminococcus sp.]|nr:hypothetical protein [Candidatus Apopatosoma intestinale]
MKKRNLLALLLATLMMFSALIVFSSCGASTANLNFEVPEVGYDGSEVTITFSHTMGSNLTPVLNLYIEEFNKL